MGKPTVFLVAKPFETNARLNATAFYYDYKDYQAFSLTGLTPQVTNSDATVSGGEIEFFWTPGDGWDVVLGAAFLDSEVDFVPAVFPGTGTTNADGCQRIARAARFRQYALYEDDDAL